MLSPDSNAPLAEASLEPVPTTPDAPAPPDAVARILEPRVRSNAKNNPKNAPKTTVPPAVIAAAEAPKTSDAPPLKNAEESAEMLREVRDLLLEMQENGQSRDRAFDLLYEELNGYKNDFYLERLKPTLRALLFLLDSIEEFERETESYQARGEAPPGEIVQANLAHFREQLVDVLTISDLSPIAQSDDKFDPKTQRAVEVVPVEATQNNTVQRQVRGGWKLGGKMLRPADVVVGRSS